MSIFNMAFTGTMPIGNLLVGYVAGKFGPTMVLVGSGIICAIVAAIFYRQLPKLRAAAAPFMATIEIEETVG